MLNEAPVPRVEVDLPRLYQSLADRQAWRLRRWRRVAVVFGAVAAVLLLVFGLRVEVHLQSGQMIVRWGDVPPGTPSRTGEAPVQTRDRRDAGPTIPTQSIEAELRVLSDLIHALKQDADERDRRFDARLDRLQKHVLALREQADLRWNATEQDVAALYLLTRKGEKP